MRWFIAHSPRQLLCGRPFGDAILMILPWANICGPHSINQDRANRLPSPQRAGAIRSCHVPGWMGDPQARMRYRACAARPGGFMTLLADPPVKPSRASPVPRHCGRDHRGRRNAWLSRASRRACISQQNHAPDAPCRSSILAGLQRPEENAQSPRPPRITDTGIRMKSTFNCKMPHFNISQRMAWPERSMTTPTSQARARAGCISQAARPAKWRCIITPPRMAKFLTSTNGSERARLRFQGSGNWSQPSRNSPHFSRHCATHPAPRTARQKHRPAQGSLSFNPVPRPSNHAVPLRLISCAQAVCFCRALILSPRPTAHRQLCANA